MKVLDSVRILEIGGLGPGPFCAMHFADLGADVISMVRDAGDGGDTAPVGTLLNQGKRSVFTDLKTNAGRELVKALIADADALIEGIRPGVMERLGLGPEECMQLNPRLVYGRMTGWGQSGPLAPRAGHVALRAVLLPILIVVMVLGSIFGGLATPTEAAAIGVLGALVAAALNRQLAVPVVRNAAMQTLRLTTLNM